jgi:hypothetical protein
MGTSPIPVPGRASAVLLAALLCLSPGTARSSDGTSRAASEDAQRPRLVDPNCIVRGVTTPTGEDGSLIVSVRVGPDGSFVDLKQVGGAEAPSVMAAIAANAARCQWTPGAGQIGRRHALLILGMHEGKVELIHPSRPRWNWREKLPVLVALILTWGASVVVWRWALRRLHLSGVQASNVSDRERLVRRNLRAILAFNVLLLYPVGVLGTVAALLSGGLNDPDVFLMLPMGLLLFSAPLPSLIRSAATLRRQRLAREPSDDAPSIWLDGGGALAEEASEEASKGNPYLGYALLVIGVGGLVLLREWSRGFQGPPWLGIGILLLGAVLAEVGRRRKKKSSPRAVGGRGVSDSGK